VTGIRRDAASARRLDVEIDRADHDPHDIAAGRRRQLGYAGYVEAINAGGNVKSTKFTFTTSKR
jgi:hypothetical protein